MNDMERIEREQTLLGTPLEVMADIAATIQKHHISIVFPPLPPTYDTQEMIFRQHGLTTVGASQRPMPPADTPYLSTDFQLLQDKKRKGTLTANTIPKTRTRLFMATSQENWENGVSAAWDKLMDVMREHGRTLDDTADGQGERIITPETAVNPPREKAIYRPLIGQQLASFAWGRWRGNFETLDASLKTFARFNERFPFGSQSFQFVLLDNPVFREPVSRGWMIGRYRHNWEAVKTVETEPGILSLDATKEGGWPYAEVTARQAADFLKVELWHNGRFVDALFDYLFKLWTALLEDGLEPVQTAENEGSIQRHATLFPKQTLDKSESKDVARELQAGGTAGAGQTPKRAGGRPRNPEDDWAWKQIHRLNRPRDEVYREWLKRIGERAKLLSDANESFNKATKLKRGQGKIPEETE